MFTLENKLPYQYKCVCACVNILNVSYILSHRPINFLVSQIFILLKFSTASVTSHFRTRIIVVVVVVRMSEW